MTDAQRFLAWPDTHIPYHDRRKVNVALKVVKDWKPDVVLFLGDLDDMEAPSRFAQGTPDEWKSRLAITTETETRKFLHEFRHDYAPSAKIIYLEGNHEARLYDYVQKKAPALDGLVTLEKILGLAELDIEFHHYSEPPMRLFPGWYAHHGNYIRQYNGDSARKELETWKVSGWSGHTHRLGPSYSEALDGKDLEWWECGHLADNNKLDYTNVHNWQHGFVYAYVERNKVFNMPARFIGNTVYFDGVRYQG